MPARRWPSSRASPFDLLLADVVMPQMSGPELGRQLQQAHPSLRVLYMSGFADHPAVHQSADRGSGDLLRKPFTAEELLARIRSTLDEEGPGHSAKNLTLPLDISPGMCWNISREGGGMSPGPHGTLSRRERQIIDILYGKGRATVREIRAGMADAPSYSAVRTTVNILERKGLLTHTSSGSAHIYWPVVPRQKAARGMVQHLLATYFDNSVEKAVIAMLRAQGRRSQPKRE